MSVNPAEPATTFPCIELGNLFDLTRSLDAIPWRPFRPGVEIHRFYGDGVDGPSAALIRFLEDAPIPRHGHEGHQHVLILAGRQEDGNDMIEAGTLRIHPPGTAHSITWSKGWVVLAIHEEPVKLIGA